MSYANSEYWPQSITTQFMLALDELFYQLNDKLFEPHLRDGGGRWLGRAPKCIMATRSNRPMPFDYPVKAIWSKQSGRTVDKITIVFARGNPVSIAFLGSSIAHEMVHATQYRDGTFGRRNYHNADFRDRMKSIGLQIRDTHWAETGYGVSNHIIEGGPFQHVIGKIVDKGFVFPS